MATYTACYTKIEAGYMGRLLEWPEVMAEGATLEECRAMLIDAAQEICVDNTAKPHPTIQTIFQPSPTENLEAIISERLAEEHLYPQEGGRDIAI